MFGLFRKRENSQREGLRQDFERATTKLRRADPFVQAAVGHSINMANSIFMQRFGNVDQFRALPKDEKIQYIMALSRAEEGFAKDQPHAAVGFALFKMWIGALTAEDEELVQQFSKALAVLSAQGDVGM